MIYEFKNDDTGEVLEEHFSPANVPSIGEYIERDGKRFRRVFSAELDTAGIARKTHQYPFTSRSLPKWLPGCEHDKKGRPIIRSQSHERSILSEHSARTGEAWQRE